MDQRKTAAIGSSFARVYWGKPAALRKAELKSLWETYLPEQKPAWTLKKDTQVVVQGVDADEAVLAEARARGLEVVSATKWLGFEEASEASSLADYFRRLVARGFRFDTGCNEGDGTTDVVTVPLVKVAGSCALSPPDLARLTATSPQALDVLNTLVVTATRLASEWLGPAAEAATDAWFMPTASSPRLFRAPGTWGGTPDLTAVRAKGSDGAVIPGEVLEERCRMLGDQVFTLQATRLQAVPVRDAPKTVLALGGLEKGATDVSLVLVRVVHT